MATLQKTPTKTPTKTGVFVKPADLFRARRPRKSFVTCSPLKCLGNSFNSPVKTLPKLLINPFQVKLNDAENCSPLKIKSPKKRRIWSELDEDANLEPPNCFKFNDRNQIQINTNSDDWTLKTKLRIKFEDQAHNWCVSASTSHHRSLESTFTPEPQTATKSSIKERRLPKTKLIFDSNRASYIIDRSNIPNIDQGDSGMDSPKTPRTQIVEITSLKNNQSQQQNHVGKINFKDFNLSLEGLKNISTFYQSPYLPWLNSLYPRAQLDLSSSSIEKTNNQDMDNVLIKYPRMADSILQDWSESFQDLFSLVSDGRCQYFYFCAEMYTIIFRHISTDTNVLGAKSPMKMPFESNSDQYDRIEALISSTSYGLKSELNKHGITLEFPNSILTSTAALLKSSQLDDNLQNITRNEARTANANDGFTSQQRSLSSSVLMTIEDSDSLSILDACGDGAGGDGDGDETSEFLESIGLNQNDFPSLSCPSTTNLKRRFSGETSQNSSSFGVNGANQTDNQLARIVGRRNCEKLRDFLIQNRLYTISNVGKFAKIPPTLLSPVQFRKCTPCYPEITLSHAQINQSNSSNNIRLNIAQKTTNDHLNSRQTTPTSVEFKGVILPDASRRLHQLLLHTDNCNYSISQQETLETSLPFKSSTNNNNKKF